MSIVSITEDVRAELVARLAATDALLSARRAESEEVRAQLAEAQTDLSILRAELAEHAEQILAIRASASWRLSAPVRLAGRLVESVALWHIWGRERPSTSPPPSDTPIDTMNCDAVTFARPHECAAQDSQGRPPEPRASVAGTLADPLLLAVDEPKLTYRPTFSILMPICDAPPRSLRRALDSMIWQAYPEWELILCDDGSTRPETLTALEAAAQVDARIHLHTLGAQRGIVATTSSALGMAAGEFVAMLDYDHALLPAALLEVARALNADRTLDLVYTDHDAEGDGEGTTTFYKPFWSLEMFRGVLHERHLLVVRRTLAEELGGLDPTWDSALDFELMLCLAEDTQRIEQVPVTLYRWREIPERRVFAKDGEGERESQSLYALARQSRHTLRSGARAVALPGSEYERQLGPVRALMPATSVVIRASGVEPYLASCCQRIVAGRRYPQLEVLVIGGDISRDLRVRLEAMGAVLVAGGEEARTAGQAGLERAAGELIISMAGDLQVHTPDWLEHFLAACELPGVACVTPLILSADGKVADAGLRTAAEASVGSATSIVQPAAAGPRRLSCLSEVSALSGECYAVTRRVLDALGGLNPYYGGDRCQAIDLSMRALSAGQRTVCTPHVIFRHEKPTLGGEVHDALDELLLADTWARLPRRSNPSRDESFGRASAGHWM
jgi:hypothetical protein